MRNVKVNTAASVAIAEIADQYGLVDVYADSPGANRGEYVGKVNGVDICCSVFDVDPEADLHALQAAIRAAIEEAA